MSREGDDPRLWVFSVGKRKGLPMIVVEPEGGHWLWQGTTASGYGQITYPTKRFPKMRIGRRRDHCPGWRTAMAHQLFYFMKFGNPPPDTELGHTCNRRSCCNPDHVRPITSMQNAAEMYRMPALSRDERACIEEMLREDVPSRQIADYYNVSVWSVRKIAQGLGQLAFDDLGDVPF